MYMYDIFSNIDLSPWPLGLRFEFKPPGVIYKRTPPLFLNISPHPLYLNSEYTSAMDGHITCIQFHATPDAQTIDTDVVDYITTIPPKIRPRYTRNIIWGYLWKRVLTWSSSLQCIYFLFTYLFWSRILYCTKIYQWVRFLWGRGCTVGISSPRTMMMICPYYLSFGYHTFISLNFVTSWHIHAHI